MKQFKIDSFDSINNFLFEIYRRSEKIFDPAEDLKNLTDQKGAPVFTENESEYLNKVMTECFIFCVLNDLNIYTLATIVEYDFYQLQAVA